MERRKAVYIVLIDGKDITPGLVAVVTSITVVDGDGEKADSATIDLDDSNGQIALPRVGAKIEVGLGWEGDIGAVICFEGKVDDLKSTGGRGQGRMLSISAKSADTRGKLKQNDDKHKDDATLGDVASEWGKDAGLADVKVHPDLAKIKRDYWSMDRESFLSWAARTASEIGATFKVMGERAIFVPRSSGQSASGKPLAKITAAWGENLISWNMSPVQSRDEYKTFEANFYDRKEAKWKTKTFDAKEVGSGIEASKTKRFSSADEDSAESDAQSEGKESDREKGGGSVEIDGNPAAQAEAECQLSGTRPGIDGTYRVEKVTHRYTRSSGFTTTLDLKQPKGEAGKDNRKSEPAGGASGSAKTLTSPNNSSVNGIGDAPSAIA
ncbi:phage late control D family protein [Bosea sp. MMO-172]|uniref:phage late control D family protein n=1 Tax=Bosea sp. MMO-172 TaxID=3127885 RepID=UPI00301747CB